MEFDPREKEVEVFKILTKLKEIKDIVLIGGYSLNAYVDFPRFSVDCDFVVSNHKEIVDILEKEGLYLKQRKKGPIRDFITYQKTVNKSKITIDLMIKKVIDRQSGIIFDFSDILENSGVRELPAKSDPSLKVKLKIVDPEMLFVLKFTSLRDTDMRDIFILQTASSLKKDKVKEFVKKYIKDDIRQVNAEKLKKAIESSNFRSSLQSVFGRLPEDFIDKNKEKLLKLVS
jgi:hypothetical protein